MAEAKTARLKLAKQDWKETNELLVAVGKQDEARVRRLLGRRQPRHCHLCS